MSEYSINRLVRKETIADVEQLIDLVRPDTLRQLMSAHPANDQRTDHYGGVRATYHDKSGLWIFYDETDKRVRNTDVAPSPIQFTGPVDYKVHSTAKQILRLAYQQQEDARIPSRVFLPRYEGRFDWIVPA